MPLSVLHVIPSISPHRGGPSIFLNEFCRQLDSCGVSSDLLTIDDSPSPVLLKTDGFSSTKPPVSSYFTYPKSLTFIPCLDDYTVSFRAVLFLWKNLSNYDVIHFHCIFSFLTSFGMLICRLHNKPYIVNTIGQLGCWAMKQGSFKKSLYLWTFESKNISSAHSVICDTSTELIESRVFIPSANYKVIRRGVSIRTHPLASGISDRGSTLRLLFVSRIHPKKGLNFLFQALSKLLMTNPDKLVTLDIVGDGNPEYIASLQQLCVDLKISHLVHWLGPIYSDHRFDIMAASDYLVLPSFSENFGIAVAESLASGTPVLLTPGVALSELASKYPEVIYVSSQSTLSTCISALEPPTQAQRELCLELSALEFRWSSIVNEYIELYRDVTW